MTIKHVGGNRYFINGIYSKVHKGKVIPRSLNLTGKQERDVINFHEAVQLFNLEPMKSKNKLSTIGKIQWGFLILAVVYFIVRFLIGIFFNV